MEENIPNKFDDFFKKQLNEKQSLDSTWDEPSDEVWLGIENAIQDDRKPIIFWLKRFGAVAAISLLFFTAYSSYSNFTKLQSKVVQQEEAIKNAHKKIEELEKEKSKVLSPVYDIKENLETNITQQNNFVDKPNKTKSNNPSTSNNRLNPVIETQAIIVEKQENNFQPIKSNTPIANKEEKAGFPYNVIKQENIKETVLLSNIETRTASIPLVSSPVYLEDMLTPLRVKTNTKVSKFKPQVYAGLNYRVGKTSPTFKNKKNNPFFGKKEDENRKYNTDFGGHLGLNFARNWSIETGLIYKNRTVFKHYNKEIEYDSSKETLNAEGNYESKYEDELKTSYGDVGANLLVVRSSDYTFMEGEKINLPLSTKINFNQFRIPLSVKYDISWGPLRISPKTGIGINIINKSTACTFIKEEVKGLENNKSCFEEKKINGINPINVDLELGLGISYALGKHFRLSAGPSYTQNISPFVHKGKFKNFERTFDLDLSLSYYF